MGYLNTSYKHHAVHREGDLEDKKNIAAAAQDRYDNHSYDRYILCRIAVEPVVWLMDKHDSSVQKSLPLQYCFLETFLFYQTLTIITPL